jgi:coenzyme PQQ biosynthesis protein PqqD
VTPLRPSDVPRFPPGVRLRFDPVRNAQVLLAPERAFDLDAQALAVLELVDGERSIAAIAEGLAARYDADRAEIEADILPMLAELTAKRVIET